MSIQARRRIGGLEVDFSGAIEGALDLLNAGQVGGVQSHDHPHRMALTPLPFRLTCLWNDDALSKIKCHWKRLLVLRVFTESSG